MTPSRRWFTREGAELAGGALKENTAIEIDEADLQGEKWTPRDYNPHHARAMSSTCLTIRRMPRTEMNEPPKMMGCIVAWFRPEDWEELKSLCPPGDLHDTYEEWFENVQGG